MTTTLDHAHVAPSRTNSIFEPAHCALLIIDMQRDFLEPGGFGEMLGNDVSQLRRTIEPNRRLLAAWREPAAGRSSTPARGIGPISPIFRPRKKIRGRSAQDDRRLPARWGASSIRGEAGHDIIPELYPAARRAGDR